MTRTRQQVGAYSRRKGIAFERKMAKYWSDWTGIECRRTPMSGAYGIEWGLAGDLMFMNQFKTPGQAGLCIELKCGYNWTWDGILKGRSVVFQWWAKLAAEAESLGAHPVLMMKKARGDIWVAVDSQWTCGVEHPRDPTGQKVSLNFESTVHVCSPQVITFIRASEVSRWVIPTLDFTRR